MPKRKREAYMHGGAPALSVEQKLAAQKESATAQLANCKKLLNRALKTARGFERQKLAKRLKNAEGKGAEGVEDAKRLERENEVVKVCHFVFVLD